VNQPKPSLVGPTQRVVARPVADARGRFSVKVTANARDLRHQAAVPVPNLTDFLEESAAYECGAPGSS